MKRTLLAVALLLLALPASAAKPKLELYVYAAMSEETSEVFTCMEFLMAPSVEKANRPEEPFIQISQRCNTVMEIAASCRFAKTKTRPDYILYVVTADADVKKTCLTAGGIWE